MAGGKIRQWTRVYTGVQSRTRTPEVVIAHKGACTRLQESRSDEQTSGRRWSRLDESMTAFSNDVYMAGRPLPMERPGSA